MHTLKNWDPENEAVWESEARRIAFRNLWISIPNLLMAFGVWIYWSIIINVMQGLHDSSPSLYAFNGPGDQPLSGPAYQALLYTLPAVAGLAGATLRIPNSFMIAVCGGRNVNFMTTLLLALPALGTGLALQNPQTPFITYIVLASLCGVGGGAFASSMSNINFFFPKRMQGLSLGLNAGLGNLGVSVFQFAIPWIITFGFFGGPSRTFKGNPVWLQNAGYAWVPILLLLALLAALFMNNLAQHNTGSTLNAIGKFLWLEALGYAGVFVSVALLLASKTWNLSPGMELLATLLNVAAAIALTMLLMRFATPASARAILQKQFAIFTQKHNWIMTYLYVMTFGSFIGYASAFPKLLKDVFGYIRVDPGGAPLPEALVNPDAPNVLLYAFLGAAMGAAIRPLGGWLSDKLGGARVTQWSTLIMIGAALACAAVIRLANASPHPHTLFLPFLLLFILLFATTGIGNGSTFRMIAVIFPKEFAGPVLGWTSAVAAYGAFLIPAIFAMQIKAGKPEYALYGFAFYYVTCLALNWWYYARKNAEIPC
ncbi:MAG: NarK/NasA family nitrate transporter [Candidatus Hydrogenedentes bacterium]|nr:NarK/NasA family nitrate transporter [Candidatus Hydrogenedentota bacterium]